MLNQNNEEMGRKCEAGCSHQRPFQGTKPVTVRPDVAVNPGNYGYRGQAIGYALEKTERTDRVLHLCFTCRTHDVDFYEGSGFEPRPLLTRKDEIFAYRLEVGKP